MLQTTRQGLACGGDASNVTLRDGGRRVSALLSLETTPPLQRDGYTKFFERSIPPSCAVYKLACFVNPGWRTSFLVQAARAVVSRGVGKDLNTSLNGK